MVKTLVVVGAGPGLGMGVARAFGRQGFQVGLIARTKEKLDALVGELAELGVTAAAFPADIRDRDALTSALTAARDRLGPIDVLEYSPSPTGPITHATQTTVDSVTAQWELHVLGAVTAVGQVLPEMLARGDGTLLLTTGVSSTVPAPFLANVGMAMVGLRNWAHTLHAELKPHGIHAGTVTIASGITLAAAKPTPTPSAPVITACTSSGAPPKRSSATWTLSGPSSPGRAGAARLPHRSAPGRRNGQAVPERSQLRADRRATPPAGGQAGGGTTGLAGSGVGYSIPRRPGFMTCTRRYRAPDTGPPQRASTLARLIITFPRIEE